MQSNLHSETAAPQPGEQRGGEDRRGRRGNQHQEAALVRRDLAQRGPERGEFLSEPPPGHNMRLAAEQGRDRNRPEMDIGMFGQGRIASQLGDVRRVG